MLITLLPTSGYAEAVKLRTTRQHDHAVQPRCPHFGPCGGCTLQSLDYAAQLAAKEAYVRLGSCWGGAWYLVPGA
jgi:23S rRNA (uracil1939-C5)-methyltransferase